MAMDNFKEEIIIRRNNGIATLLYYLLWIIMILSLIIGVVMVNIVISAIAQGAFNWMGIIWVIGFLGMAALIWFKKDSLKVEYEYTFTNGTLDIAMVLNNSKRKYLAEIPLKLVESAGSVKHPSFQRYLNDKQLKKHNWFLNRDSDLVYLYFTKNSVRRLVVIEPSPDMQELMHSKGYMNFGVWQK